MSAALVNHPYFGSLWLDSAEVREDDDGKKYVVGTVEADRIFGHPIYEWMNFPLTCVRKWTPPEEAP